MTAQDAIDDLYGDYQEPTILDEYEAEDVAYDQELIDAEPTAAPKAKLVGMGKSVQELMDKGKAAIQAEPTVEDEPPPLPHWIERVDKNNRPIRNAFWAFAGSIGLDHDAVHQALGVDHVAEYVGTMDEAKEAMEQYAARLAGQL